MISSPARLDRMKASAPEWTPWLDVVQNVINARSQQVWHEAVPTDVSLTAPVPLLKGATVSISADAVMNLLARLTECAARIDTPAMASLQRIPNRGIDPLASFAASVGCDDRFVEATACRYDVDVPALQSIVALLGWPFLQACRERWQPKVAPAWVEPYCPVCGGWPTLDELRGIERRRFHRCGRCGSEWHAEMLCCTYCGMRDHQQLAMLVPETGGPNGSIDACNGCGGYVKVMTRLQGSAPDEVLLEDLASIDLDLAAVDAGYRRPQSGASALDLTVVARVTPRRWFS